MTRQIGSFVFGFAACAIFNPATQDLVSFIDTVGEVTINTKPELITAFGGPGAYASAARAGRAEGDVTLTINERANDLYQVLGFATVTEIGVQAGATIGTLVNVAGSSVTAADAVTLSVTAGATPIAGRYTVEVSAANTFIIRGATAKGVRSSGPVAVAASGNAATSLGLTITRGATAVVVNDKAAFSVTPAAADARRYDFLDAPDSVEVGLKLFSEIAETGQPYQDCTVNRCVLLPPDYMLRSSQMGSEAQELTGKMLVPASGIPFSVTEYDVAA